MRRVSTAKQGSSRVIEAELVAIREALEVAFVVARRDRRDHLAPQPPRKLGPILEFASLPERALGTVRDALDNDGDFRRRVTDQVDVEALDEGSMLFLTRPDGWADALAVLVDQARIRHETDDIVARHGEVAEALSHLQESHDELVRERDGLAVEIAGLRGSATTHAQRAEELETRLAEALEAVEELRQLRGEAVRQLKAQESLAQRRLQRQRELEDAMEAQLASRDRHDEHTVDVGPDRVEVARAEIDHVSTLVAELASKVDDLADHLRSLDPDRQAGDDAAGGADHGADRGADHGVEPGVFDGVGPHAATPRRRPVRLGRALAEDSLEGLEALLGLPGVTVMVDGYNVSMKGWPNLGVSQQRESLVNAVGGSQRRHGGIWHLVFDGDRAGGRPVVSAPLPVRVHFTPAGLEADDRLLEFVEQSRGDLPVVVVSSDNRVRDGARERGANVVSAETLLSLLRA